MLVVVGIQVVVRCPLLAGREMEVEAVLSHSLSEAKYYQSKKKKKVS